MVPLDCRVGALPLLAMTTVGNLRLGFACLAWPGSAPAPRIALKGALLVAVGVERTVPDSVRQAVDAVQVCLNEGAAEVSNATLAKKLGLDPGATSRRVRQAKHRGFIKNLEDKKGKPARLVLGDPMPDDLDVLPKPDTLEGVLHCCSVVGGDTKAS